MAGGRGGNAENDACAVFAEDCAQRWHEDGSIALDTVAHMSCSLSPSLLLSFLPGFFLGAVQPLFYELSAELTYPSPESTSAAIMTLVNNMVMLILYTTTPQFDVSNINTLMTCTVGVSLVLMLTLTEEYKRQDAGVTHKHHNAGVAAVLQYYSQVEDDEDGSG